MGDELEGDDLLGEDIVGDDILRGRDGRDYLVGPTTSWATKHHGGSTT